VQHRDLSVLEEHGLVAGAESGSDDRALGRDAVVEAIIDNPQRLVARPVEEV